MKTNLNTTKTLVLNFSKEIKNIKLFVICIGLLILQSCRDKQLTEVVEVPLPTAEEKILIGNPSDVKANPGTFALSKLPYKYDALAPAIDSRTLEIHYSKHYLTYTNNLNALISGTEMAQLPIEEILAKAEPDTTGLRNNAGGYYNHKIYWESMGGKANSKPKDTLAAAINKDFGSYDQFLRQFKNAAEKQFGSGWAWLIVDKTGKLQVTTTPNQDNPLMPKVKVQGKPLLAIDVWEHAYYINYQYKRRNYIEAFLTIINWEEVQKKYEATLVAPN